MIVSAFPFSDRSREALNSGAGSIGSISILLDRKLAAGEFNENSGIFVYNLFSQWNPVTFAPAERINSRWMIQGVANYYQLLVLVRTGLISEQVFLNHLASAYEHYYRELNQRQISPRSARNVDAAQGYVQAAELLTALSVDLKMRSAIARPSSLDNLLAGLAQRFSGNNRTYSDIQLYELIDTLSGLFLKPYVDTCLNYPIRMNVPMLLNDFGIKMELVRKGQPDLGLRFKSSTDFTVVDLPRGGAAFDAGLESGDKILKINGRTFGSVDSLATYVNGRKVGDKLKVEYLRGKEKLTTTLILEGLDQWRASISPERTPAQAERWKKLVSPLS